MKNRSVAFAAFVVCAFILPRAASAQGVNAFDNPGFEEHSKFGAVKKGLRYCPEPATTHPEACASIPRGKN